MYSILFQQVRCLHSGATQSRFSFKQFPRQYYLGAQNEISSVMMIIKRTFVQTLNLRLSQQRHIQEAKWIHYL